MVLTLATAYVRNSPPLVYYIHFKTRFSLFAAFQYLLSPRRNNPAHMIGAMSSERSRVAKGITTAAAAAVSSLFLSTFGVVGP